MEVGEEGDYKRVWSQTSTSSTPDPTLNQLSCIPTFPLGSTQNCSLSCFNLLKSSAWWRLQQTTTIINEWIRLWIKACNDVCKETTYSPVPWSPCVRHPRCVQQKAILSPQTAWCIQDSPVPQTAERMNLITVTVPQETEKIITALKPEFFSFLTGVCQSECVWV